MPETSIEFKIRRNGQELTGTTTPTAWSWGDTAVDNAARLASYGARPGDRKHKTIMAMKLAAQRALAKADMPCYF